MRSLSATSIHIFIMQAVNVEQEGSNVMGNIDQKKPYSSVITPNKINEEK